MVVKSVKGTRVAPGNTSTTLFLLPITGNLKSDLLKHGFLNAYVEDELKKGEYENCIICLFQPKDLVDFDLFVEEERNKINFVDEYDYDGGFSVLVYSLGAEYQDDIDRILKGKYSSTTKKYQQLIPKFMGIMTKSIQHMVFEKSPAMKKKIEELYDIELPEDIDYWEMFNIDDETLKFI